ncbi:GAF domain-containing protein [Mycolicibacterium mageritense]|uniref:GAF domain-containing protein n=1 Tax=Mycolicibacterium mageritense TaxID=53462 RepID=A0ABM7HXX0_MYCME|nr:GAF domain-containing protein [Mycolicibacterium mageritense]CDO20044.1 response regulator receiver/ANTAR domain-containing protein [Mycolicibacterium mageritense DSM 44476 = CIP 104973]
MSGGGVGDAVELDAAMTELVRRSSGGANPDHYVILAKIVMAAAEQLPAVDHAGVALFGESGVIRSLAATDGDALMLDHVQRLCGQGPGYQSAADGRAVHVDDLSVEKRWPAFVEQASALTPIRSILMFPLLADGGDSAVLAMSADGPSVFLADVVKAGSVFAKHAAGCLEAARNQPPVRCHVAAVGSRSRRPQGVSRWVRH